MILVDVNLLLYAEDAASPHHRKAWAWFDAHLSGTEPVCFCWPVLTAFLRISTNPRIYEHPLTTDQAVTCVQRWLDQPAVRLVSPTERHWEILAKLLLDWQATGNLVPDAHLAALAIEHRCVLCSADSHFARCPGLRWENPLA